MKPEIVTLRDPSSGASAEILVSQGFNCYRFTVSTAGQPIEVIYAPEGFASGNDRPSRGGIPILFPFAGRIPGTRLSWQGSDYALEPGDAFGNAIHGFVLSRPWRVLEQSESRVVGQFHAWRDDPSLQERWPADFRITATYTLAAGALRTHFLFENPCDVPLPCGFGTHPYFRLPLGGENADDCVVKMPVSKRWELQSMLPTGRRLDVAEAADLQRGTAFRKLQLDDVFSGLKFEAGGGRCEASIFDPASRRTLTIQFDRTFRECVVYTPPHREAICIEPYTFVPGAFYLESRGIEAGLRILEPAGSFTAVVDYLLT